MAQHEHDVDRGRFVTRSTAEREPGTTGTGHGGNDRGDREVHRSTSTGRFIKRRSTDTRRV